MKSVFLITLINKSVGTNLHSNDLIEFHLKIGGKLDLQLASTDYSNNVASNLVNPK